MPPSEADLQLYTITQLVQTLVRIALSWQDVFALRCRIFRRQILQYHFTAKNSAIGVLALVCELLQLTGVTSAAYIWVSSCSLRLWTDRGETLKQYAMEVKHGCAIW